MSWSTGALTARGRRTFLPTRSYRSLTGRFDFSASPGSKLPGYLHFVPSGQKSFLRPVHEINSTSQVEDEDDDEYEDDTERQTDLYSSTVEFPYVQ